MNKRILLSLILGTFAANPGVMLGMHAPHKTVNKENTKNLDRANTQDSPSKRLIFWFSQCLTKFRQCPRIWSGLDK